MKSLSTLIKTVLTATLALAAPLASAQMPADAHPVRIVVGVPPGGALDQLARLLADELRSATGEPYLVDNRRGSSTRLAIESARNALADGRTILIASTAPLVIFPMTYKRLVYDVDKDFVLVAIWSMFRPRYRRESTSPTRT